MAEPSKYFFRIAGLHPPYNENGFPKFHELRESFSKGSKRRFPGRANALRSTLPVMASHGSSRAVEGRLHGTNARGVRNDFRAVSFGPAKRRAWVRRFD